MSSSEYVGELEEVEEESSIGNLEEIVDHLDSALSKSSTNIISSIVNQYTLDYYAKHDKQEEVEEESRTSDHIEEKQRIGIIDTVKEYLSRRRIGDLLHYMMQHLLVNEPDDPVTFLQQLVDKCLMFRSGILCEPPLVFEDRHISSLYSSLDPLNVGLISVKQYHVGMLTLGLKEQRYEMKPELQEDGSVSKQTFLTNAKMALVESFMDMVLLPPPRSDGTTSSTESFYE